MTRIEQIEEQITSLSPSELQAFREWFAEYDAEAWDRQIESDAQNGRLAGLAEGALRDYQAGRSTEL